MGARAAISADEYLHTSFADYDREFMDGELVERSLPDYLHSRTQALITKFFEALAKRLPVFTCDDLRVRLREGLIRIPDLSVYWPDEPAGDVPDTPPLIAIEILSKDDRFGVVRDKLEEYRVWGVKHVWLVDPRARLMYVFDGGLRQVQSLRAPELDAELLPADAFPHTTQPQPPAAQPQTPQQ